MKKVVILGCENSHADDFLRIISENKEFSEIEVVGVYSLEPDAMKVLNEKYGVPLMSSLEEFVGKVDGVIITARDGVYHYPFAKPYIKEGAVMFIDKPITITEEEGVAFMKELISKGVKVTGGSIVKHDEFVQKLKKERLEGTGEKILGGLVRAPYQPNSAHSGFYFYAQHLVEMLCEIFGRFPKSVYAHANGTDITTIFKYEDYDAVGVFADNNYEYFAMIHTEKEMISSKVFTPAPKLCSYKEFKDFYDLLVNNRKGVDYKEFISPVFIMNAIKRSLKSGKEEKVNEILL